MRHSASAQRSSVEYVWKFPGSPVRIHLAYEVISRLRDQIALADERETGGLLLGFITKGRVHATDFEPFPLDPGQRHFNLSEQQTVRLQDAIRLRQQNGSRVKVVGYYRSDTRNGIQLTPQDLALIDTTFRDESYVFLVVSTSHQTVPYAGFFFWDKGSIFENASFMEFPFDENLLLSRGQMDPPSQDASTSRNKSGPGLAPISRLKERHNAQIPRRPLYAAAAVLSMIAVASTLWLFAGRNKSTGQPQAEPASRATFMSPLSLWASRTNGNVAITWDSARPLIANARVGVVTITDHGAKNEFPLSKSQLQSSKLLYASNSRMLEITMEVFSATGTTTQEAILLTAPEDSERSRTGSDVAVVRRPVSTQVRKEGDPELTRARVRRFTAMVSNPLPSAPAAVVMSDPDLGSHVPTPHLQTPDFLATPRIQVAAKPSDLVARQTTEQRPITAVVQAPVAIHQVKPALTAAMRTFVKAPVVVQVRTFIDADGKVIKVEPSVAGGAINDYLARAAANAARMWRFQPARRGDTNLPSEVLLHFTFGPVK